MSLIILLLLFIYKEYIYFCCKYLELYTYPVLRDGIKLFAVATRDQKFSMYHAWILKEGKSTVKYYSVYERWLEPSRNIIYNLVRVRRLDCFRLHWVSVIY